MPDTPPGPGDKGAFRNLRRFLDNRAEFLYEMWQEYGDFCRFQLGPAKVYLVSDPELIREVLVEHDLF